MSFQDYLNSKYNQPSRQASPMIIGYTFEADSHCVKCTQARFKVNPDAKGYKPSDSDQNYIPYNGVDREGNNIHALFSTDELLFTVHCGDCGALLYEHEEN